MPKEQPSGWDPEEKKAEGPGEGKEADKESEKGGFLLKAARKILHATGRVGYPEEIPSGEKKETSEKEKKEAAKGFLGLKLGGATLVGVIALALGGAIISLQKLNALDKTFMKGYNIAFGGGKGGGGKK